MDFINIIILSAVEGVTEFLPISSTAHLILVSNLLQIPQTDFLKTFEIAIQSGAVLAVLNLYWKKFVGNKELVVKALVGVFPTLLIGATLYPLVKGYLFESTQNISIVLIVGGIFILFIENRLKKRENKPDKLASDLSKVTYKQAFFTGLTQSLGIIPGVSRSAASIFGAILFGMSRKTATEFSFILALPTIIAATGYDLLNSAPNFSQNEIVALIIGIILSFVVALISIKWLLKYISTHSFVSFGWYRIIIGIIFLLLFI